MKEAIESSTPQIVCNLPPKLRAKLAMMMSGASSGAEVFDTLTREEQIIIEQTIEDTVGK